VLDKTAKLNASGPTKGGTILIGGSGNLGSKKHPLASARSTTVAAGAILTADGGTGQGGTVVVWSEQQTDFAGKISARGATGGAAEVSGHQLLNYTGVADLRGADGLAGTLLLDPADVYITSTGTAPTGASIIDPATIVSQLALTNLTVTTNGGTGNGDITVATPVTFGGINTLTLSAYRGITLSAPVTATGTGSVALSADSSGTGTGTVNFVNSGLISLNGGTASIYYNPASYTAPTNYSPFVTGGALTSYMLVNSGTQLAAINNNTAGNYALNTNIDLTGAGFNGITSLSGILDARGHTISNLNISNTAASTLGLVGTLQGTVTDLVLTGVNVTNRNYVGAVAGLNYGTISDLTVAGSVTGSYYIGGVAGWNYGTISAVSANVNVQANIYGGGITGVNLASLPRYPALIQNVSSSGHVTATRYGAGIAGYNSGTISGALSVGAIVAAVKKDWSWFFGAVVLSIGIGIMITIITKSFTATI